MTKHILQDKTEIEVLPTTEVAIRQGDQFVVFSREKAVEALLFVLQPEFRSRCSEPPPIILYREVET
jgi:hypothetical protein